MDIYKIDEDLIDEIHLVLEQINKLETKALAEHILKAKRIFTCGAGESGVVAQGFALRLLHLGLNAGFVRKKFPKMNAKDLLIAVSGSGETKPTLDAAEKAKKNCTFVIAITESRHSSLQKHSNAIVEMKIKPKIKSLAGHLIVPEHVLFEQSAFVFLDAVAIHLRQKLEIKPEKLVRRKKGFD